MRASERSRAKYPLATISAYGPDNRRATKLVVGILRRAGQKDANSIRSWTSDASDVRNDPVIASELADWLRSQGVKDTVSHDRIIGCPHEAGIDYPMGRACPQCPFWASIDRFTHERISAPVATMSPDQVLIELGKDRTSHPLEALDSADAHRGVLVQPLLEALERGITHADTASKEEAQLVCYALYLLAKWREPRAYPLVIRWLSLSDAVSTALSGDVSTQDAARILAAVCDGDLEPIKRLVLNRDADEFSRGVAVAALALLAVWAEVPRDTILDYFVWLAREGLERHTNYVWGALAAEGDGSASRLPRLTSGSVASVFRLKPEATRREEVAPTRREEFPVPSAFRRKHVRRAEPLPTSMPRLAATGQHHWRCPSHDDEHPCWCAKSDCRHDACRGSPAVDCCFPRSLHDPARRR